MDFSDLSSSMRVCARATASSLSQTLSSISTISLIIILARKRTASGDMGTGREGTVIPLDFSVKSLTSCE